MIHARQSKNRAAGTRRPDDTSLTGPLLHRRELRRVAHVARAAARPVDVGALAALPVLGAEEAARLVGGRLANLRARLLVAVGGGALAAAPVAGGASGEVDVFAPANKVVLCYNKSSYDTCIWICVLVRAYSVSSQIQSPSTMIGGPPAPIAGANEPSIGAATVAAEVSTLSGMFWLRFSACPPHRDYDFGYPRGARTKFKGVRMCHWALGRPLRQIYRKEQKHNCTRTATRRLKLLKKRRQNNLKYLLTMRSCHFEMREASEVLDANCSELRTRY